MPEGVVNFNTCVDVAAAVSFDMTSEIEVRLAACAKLMLRTKPAVNDPTTAPTYRIFFINPIFFM